MALHVPANCDLNLSIAFLKRAPTPLHASCSFIWRSPAEASGAPMSLRRAHARGDYLDRATIIILRSFCV